LLSLIGGLSSRVGFARASVNVLGWSAALELAKSGIRVNVLSALDSNSKFNFNRQFLRPPLHQSKGELYFGPDAGSQSYLAERYSHPLVF
jgi:hypothetical protein